MTLWIVAVLNVAVVTWNFHNLAFVAEGKLKANINLIYNCNNYSLYSALF